MGGALQDIAVGCSRMGLRAALLTGVGKEKLDDYMNRRILLTIEPKYEQDQSTSTQKQDINV